jgi:hypothetical protein
MDSSLGGYAHRGFEVDVDPQVRAILVHPQIAKHGAKLFVVNAANRLGTGHAHAAQAHSDRSFHDIHEQSTRSSRKRLLRFMCQPLERDRDHRAAEIRVADAWQ